MTSLLSVGDDGFWVRNAVCDFLCDALREMAKRESDQLREAFENDPAVAMVKSGAGIGPNLDALAAIFGIGEFKRITSSGVDIIETKCPHDQCVRMMNKLFKWIWHVQAGGKCAIDAPPVSKWRDRTSRLLFACTLGIVNVIPPGRRFPTLDDLPDEPPMRE